MPNVAAPNKDAARERPIARNKWYIPLTASSRCRAADNPKAYQKNPARYSGGENQDIGRIERRGLRIRQQRRPALRRERIVIPERNTSRIDLPRRFQPPGVKLRDAIEPQDIPCRRRRRNGFVRPQLTEQIRRKKRLTQKQRAIKNEQRKEKEEGGCKRADTAR